MTKSIINIGLTLFFISTYSSLFAQTEKSLSEIILNKDSLFWVAYNKCDTSNYHEFFTDDVEFYHDKGGITYGFASLLETSKKNLCSNSNFRIRRAPVPGTMKVFPMQQSDTIYGAIMSGEHLFYITENGKESLTGQAKFTHLWLLKDRQWKMARILSYDHGPATPVINKKQITLSEKALEKFTGKYMGAQSGAMSIASRNGTLILSIQDKTYSLLPETENRFFTKDRDLVFEFISTGKTVSKMIVRENGEVVEEATFSGKN